MLNRTLVIILHLGLVVQSCKSFGLSHLYPSGTPTEGELFTGLKEVTWKDKYIASKITYRLIKKSWKPTSGLLGDDVIDEYPGTMEQAFKAMKTSKYTFLEQKLETSEKLFTMKNDRGEVEYDPNLESIVIIHPWNSDAEVAFVSATITALRLRNLHKKYNIFAADMPELNNFMLKTIFRQLIGLPTNYEPMSEALSLLLVKGVEGGHWTPEKIHLIGFSYSGSLVGYMGRYIQLIYKKKLSTIVCLDPYSIQSNLNFIHVNRNDAEIVHIYHTCSFVSGTRERIGTADFVFNDGSIQPDCRKKRFQNLEPFSCSHGIAATRLWYIILYPSKFMVRQCDTWQRFMNCMCEDHSTATITYPIENNPARGVYFLKTMDHKPYGLGEEGARCDPAKQRQLDRANNAILEKLQRKINS